MAEEFNLDNLGEYPPEEVFTTDELRKLYSDVAYDVRDASKHESPEQIEAAGVFLGKVLAELNIQDEAARGANVITGSRDVPSDHYLGAWARAKVAGKIEAARVPDMDTAEFITWASKDLAQRDSEEGLRDEAAKLVLQALKAHAIPIIEERRDK